MLMVKKTREMEFKNRQVVTDGDLTLMVAKEVRIHQGKCQLICIITLMLNTLVTSILVIQASDPLLLLTQDRVG